MTTTKSPAITLPLPRCAAVLLALAAAGPCHALYKVVGPDGRITYTDRAPSSSEGKASPLGQRDAPAAPEVPLPLELRQAAGRFPVTLYTMLGACDPCEAARVLLRRRGVPYSERQVSSPEDVEALQRLTGGREAPVLTIGSQTLRGLAAELWNSYLDTAGYPRESKLPVGYTYAPPTPLVARREAAPAAATPAPAPEAAPATAPAPEGGIRF
jgi:glutaredoxin